METELHNRSSQTGARHGAAAGETGNACYRCNFINFMDRQGAKIHVMLILLPLVCIPLKWPWQECRLLVFWLAMHAALSAFHGLWCSYPDCFYWKHRSTCIVVLQSLQLSIVLEILPLAFEMAVGTQIAGGKAAHFTYALLIFGLGSYSIGTHIMVARLPWRVAACFTAARVVVSICTLLPHQARYLGHPAVQEVALKVKSKVDVVYNTAMSLSTLTAVETAAGPCSLMSLALWAHLCLAALFPLYFLYIMEHHTSVCHGVTTGSASRPTDSNSSGQAHSAGRNYESQGTSLLRSPCDVVYHLLLLFGSSMLLWALVDCVVYIFDHVASKYGVCV